jgi:hypothetical protein
VQLKRERYREMHGVNARGRALGLGAQLTEDKKGQPVRRPLSAARGVDVMKSTVGVSSTKLYATRIRMSAPRGRACRREAIDPTRPGHERHFLAKL